MSLLLINDLEDAKDFLRIQTARITELEVSLDERDATIARQQRLIHDLAASLKDAVSQFGYGPNVHAETRIRDEGLRMLAEVEAMG